MLQGKENGEVWRLYYERRELDQALSFCRDAGQIRILSRLIAANLFKDEKYSEAAQLYAKSDCRVDEVVAKFCMDVEPVKLEAV